MFACHFFEQQAQRFSGKQLIGHPSHTSTLFCEVQTTRGCSGEQIHRQACPAYSSLKKRDKRPAEGRDLRCLKRSTCSRPYIPCGRCGGSSLTQCRMNSSVRSSLPVCAHPAGVTCNTGASSW